jgi:hypothetical protein
MMLTRRKMWSISEAIGAQPSAEGRKMEGEHQTGSHIAWFNSVIVKSPRAVLAEGEENFVGVTAALSC